MKSITLDQRTDLQKPLLELNQKAWPQFLLNWNCPGWSSLFTTFSEYQILILNDSGELTAYGHTIPIFWDKALEKIPDNLKTLIEMGADTRQKGIKPNGLLALAAVVPEQYRGEGFSAVIVTEMKNLARQKGLDFLIVPARPTLKSKYPLIPIESYAAWKNEAGLFFDPWLRTHQKLGGEIFKTSEISMIIDGTIAQWETWTGMKIFDSGYYLFDGVLNPVEISRENDRGIYFDPCIWVRYDLT